MLFSVAPAKLLQKLFATVMVKVEYNVLVIAGPLNSTTTPGQN